ncbi:hypothetical protein NCCP2716_28320 [Sporosarcina sp. NCCP-2716]|uniref:hypothetical protein n=1 Tax=Sporosarcina sp. NCCP-2716 TaxID=2943679 RepID=UPI00203B3718|nr:hypothetical protein [Sporosarcina sp. NCCP-2716]GKV70334.1 hypothetical protein NCCP2716_28320 [Sporosarcina sp. NCCP-2716]
MNKRIWNGALYGLVISLALGLLMVNYSMKSYKEDLTIINYVPVYDYVVGVLRYGAIGTLIGMFIAWRKNKSEDDGPKTYYGEVFLGVLFLSCGIAALAFLFG